jgi:hypothetical protein
MMLSLILLVRRMRAVLHLDPVFALAAAIGAAAMLGSAAFAHL